MKGELKASLLRWLELERIPRGYLNMAEKHLLPLAKTISSRVQKKSTLIIGVSGAYGSGKTTMCKCLSHFLKSMNITSINVSIDDFYLSKEERINLGKQVHPLLQTRGVPGTHDNNLINSFLFDISKGTSVSIPKFDKALDDRLKSSVKIDHVDVLFFDGWCLGIPPFATLNNFNERLDEPLNNLELNEDSNLIWRYYVEKNLERLSKIFDNYLDMLVYLKVPSFDSVKRNRHLQEDKLRASNRGNPMTKEEVDRFVQFAERLTKRGFISLPSKADIVYHLDERQNIIDFHSKL